MRSVVWLCVVLLAVPAVARAAEPSGGVGAASLLAPLVAIGLALLTRQVLPSLAVGALIGVFVLTGGAITDAAPMSLGYVRAAVVDADHLTVTAFSVLVAGTVGIMGRSGGTRDMVARLERYARGRRGAMVTSWLAGVIVFFDDYANCLVVGSSMAPLYDRYGVSRAKLAYIVDSTAAPIASIALVSTWVGYEVGLIDEALAGTGAATSGFAIFIESIPYRFYSLFTIVFVGAIAFSGRDFGPMRLAEAAARATPRPAPGERAARGPERAWLAALPVATLVVVTLTLLVLDGRAALGDAAATAALFEVLGAADAYQAMLRGSGAAFALASGLSLASGALPLAGLPGAAWSGIRPVLDAIAVLFLAWILSDVVSDTGAAPFLASVLEGRMPPWIFPTVAFVLASATAFATGTSFGTMGILIPLVVPLSLAIAPGESHILLGSTAAILAGACLGDHASPISDTTILAAIGSGTDVITHVRTQLPYALTTGAVSIVFGHLPTGLGYSPWLVLPLGALACLAVVRLVGHSAADEAPAAYSQTVGKT